MSSGKCRPFCLGLNVLSRVASLTLTNHMVTPQIAIFMWPTRGPPGSYRPQMGPMLAQWTLLSGSGTREVEVSLKTMGDWRISKHNKTEQCPNSQHNYCNVLYNQLAIWADCILVQNTLCQQILQAPEEIKPHALSANYTPDLVS